MDTSKVPVKLVKVIKVLGRTGMSFLFSHSSDTDTDRALSQVHEEVSHKFVLSSWMIKPEVLSATSRALVRSLPLSLGKPCLTNTHIVREDDILCLLESEREARRLR